MKCPNGHAVQQLVIDTRSNGDTVYRRRLCCLCEMKYVTKEQLYKGPLKRMKVKK